MMTETIEQTCVQPTLDILEEELSPSLDWRDFHLDLAWKRGRKPSASGEYSCKRYAGCLKDKNIFSDDPVAIVRKLRDEE